MRGTVYFPSVLAIAGVAAAASVQPACSETAAPDPKGDWRATLAIGAVKLRLALHLGATSTFDSPDQGALGLPAQMSEANGTVTVDLRGAGRFVGRMSPDGTRLEGDYLQGGSAFPLRFERGAFALLDRPQTPKPPFPYRVEAIGYDNPAEPGVHLAGTLTLPPGAGPFPAVLLITGSGAQDRDETLFEHKPFLVLADALTRRGVAVLRVDDRGMGGSSAGTPIATTLTYAGDVEAGVAWLRTRPEIDPARIGLLGHSEGGLIAPLVASRDARIAFVVLWAGPGVPGKAIIVDQVRALSVAGGADAAATDKSVAVQRALLDALIAAPDMAAAKVAINAVMASHGAPPVDNSSLATMTSRWYRNFLTLDPAPPLEALAMPVLALLGGKDMQVSPDLNAAPLRAALRGNDLASVEILPGLNHLFQTAGTGLPAEYGQISETIAPVALDRMVDWIATTAGVR